MSLKTRLAKLEAQSAPMPAWGVQMDDGPVRVAGEEMTREDFFERFPEGDILRIRLVNGPRSPRPGAAPATAPHMK